MCAWYVVWQNHQKINTIVPKNVWGWGSKGTKYVLFVEPYSKAHHVIRKYVVLRNVLENTVLIYMPQACMMNQSERCAKGSVGRSD